jgi:hypothetical protein
LRYFSITPAFSQYDRKQNLLLLFLCQEKRSAPSPNNGKRRKSEFRAIDYKKLRAAFRAIDVKGERIIALVA